MSNPNHVHSKLSFSARARWRACPLSVHLSHNITDSPSSPAAEEGTCAHLVAEWYVRRDFRIPWGTSGLIDPAAECPPTRVPDGLNLDTPEKVDAWHAKLREHGKDYMAFIRSLIPADEVNAYVSIETPVNIRSIHPQLFGTLDLRIWLPKRGVLIIVDYKYGFQNVEVGEQDDPNAQLAAYAVASVEGMNESARAALNGIVLAVYQPRVPMGETRKTLELPATWIDVERAKLRNEVAAVENPGAPRPGDHCRYCPAKAVCPAVHNALQIALDAYAGGPNVLSMSDEQLIDLWSARKAVETLMDDINERVRKLAQASHARLTYTPVSGRTMWKNPKEAALTLLALGRHDLLQPVALSDALAAMPKALQTELTTKSAGSYRIALKDAASAAAPNVVRDMFKQYVGKA